jgi:hypothetical protein
MRLTEFSLSCLSLSVRLLVRVRVKKRGRLFKRVSGRKPILLATVIIIVFELSWLRKRISNVLKDRQMIHQATGSEQKLLPRSP